MPKSQIGVVLQANGPLFKLPRKKKKWCLGSWDQIKVRRGLLDYVTLSRCARLRHLRDAPDVGEPPKATAHTRCDTRMRPCFHYSTTRLFFSLSVELQLRLSKERNGRESPSVKQWADTRH